MKKTLLILIGIFVFYLAILPTEKININSKKVQRRHLTHKLPPKEINVIEQKITFSQSSINKEFISDKAIKNKLINSIVEAEDFNKLNDAIKDSFLESSKKNYSGPKFLKIKTYIDNFNFNLELAKQLQKISLEDLKNIVEIDKHPIEKMLKEKETKNQELIEKILNGEQSFSNSIEKQQLIDDILQESNAVEATQLFFKNILHSTYFNAIKKNNPHYNIAEIKAQAHELTQKKLNHNKGLIKKVFDISYGHLEKEDLEEYIYFLQKRNAKKATNLTLRAHNNVTRQFIQGLFRSFENQNQ